MSVHPLALSQGVETRLRELGPTLQSDEFLLLPSAQRGDEEWYPRDDIFALTDARAFGLRAKFLVPDEDRRFLSEFSAVLLIGFGIAVGAQLTGDVILRLVDYARGRARRAAERDGRQLDDPDLRLRVQVTRVRPGQGGPQLDSFEIEGPVDGALGALHDVLESGLADDSATPALPIPPAHEDGTVGSEDP